MPDPVEIPDTDALFDLGGRVAVVTGAGRGIGEGIAKTLAAAGAAVVVAARRTTEIGRVAGEIEAVGGQALAVSTDVTDRRALEALAQAAVDAFHGLHVWVNNAGGSPVRTPLVDLGRDDWDRTIDLNLTAIWEGTTVAAGRMDDGGSIINISSMASHVGVPGSGHYAAAKAATNSLTKTFALELAPRIRVNCLCPGAVPTEIMMTALDLTDDDLPDLLQSSRIPLGRLGSPVDLGAAALYLAAPASSWVTGQIIDISGGR